MRERGKLWIGYVSEASKHMRESGKLWIGYVSEAREHMRERGNDGLGMCQRQGNTCEKRKKMK